MNMKKQKTFVVYLLAILAVFLVNAPLIFMVVTSFKSQADIMTPSFKIAFTPTLDNYREVLSGETFDFPKYALNSLVIALGATLLSIVVSIPAAYGIHRFGKMKEGVAFWILSIRMLPPVVFALPFFLILRLIGLIDTRVGLIMVYLTSTVPLSVWVLGTFIAEIPRELEEAAMLDGASRGSILIKVILPLSTPGIISVFILNFIFVWNEFFFALLMTMDRATPLTVGMARFITGYSIYWGPIMASATISIIPMIVLTFLVQRYLVRGLTMGAIK